MVPSSQNLQPLPSLIVDGEAPQYAENVNLGMSYIEYLEMVTKQENEEIKSVEVNYSVDDL